MAIKIFEAATAERWENSKTEMREKKKTMRWSRASVAIDNPQSAIGCIVWKCFCCCCCSIFGYVLFFCFYFSLILVLRFYKFALIASIAIEMLITVPAPAEHPVAQSQPPPPHPCNAYLVFLLIIASSSLQQCQSVSAYFIRDTSLELLLLTML